MTNEKKLSLRKSKNLLLQQLTEWDKKADEFIAGDTSIKLSTSDRQDIVDEIIDIEDTLREIED